MTEHSGKPTSQDAEGKRRRQREINTRVKEIRLAMGPLRKELASLNRERRVIASKKAAPQS